VFKSPSNHKYDVADYYHVDPHFGGDEALLKLCAAMQERGMRLMLDIVPNHSSDTHAWFKEAQAAISAPSAEFYTFRQHPDEYESWLGVKSLPKLNYQSLKLREEMYEGENAIMRYWLRPPYSVDGWRVDVANMLGRQGETQLGHKVGRGMRRAVKAESPSAYLLGEHFFDGSPHLQGNELDAGMNYQGFTFPVWRWLAGYDLAATRGSEWADTTLLPTETLLEQWQAFRAAIPHQIVLQQFNQLGSHDVPRILSIVNGSVLLEKVGAVLQFTYPGVPCLYYGDEIGMEGAVDPDNRRCMEWDETKWDSDLRDFYRHLIALRRRSKALQEGSFQPLLAAENTLAFVRETEAEKLVIIARRAADTVSEVAVDIADIADGTVLRELFSGASATVTGGNLPLINLGDSGAQIWQI
jgi:alpha-glucosidase